MKKSHRIMLVFGILLLVVITALIILMPKIKGYLPYFNDRFGFNQEDKVYTLILDKYEYENEVAKRLEENGIVCSAYRFLGYYKQNCTDFVWRPGIYHLNANMTYKELFDALSAPDESLNYVKVTIPEGKTVIGISEIIEKSGLCSADEFLKAADSYDYDYEFIDLLKKRDQKLIGYKLEGFLFPATYEFRADTVTAREIVDTMLKTFTEYVTKDMIQKAADMGLSLDEFITFGSVIQAEAFSKESMTYVSSVFWNRLNTVGMHRLQSDPTTKYAISLENLSHYSSDMKNAYNTYSCSGLPVGPTNCPGLDVLNAVLAPADTNYLYFVTDKNGEFYYNETFREHNNTINNLKSKGLWS